MIGVSLRNACLITTQEWSQVVNELPRSNKQNKQQVGNAWYWNNSTLFRIEWNLLHIFNLKFKNFE